MVSLRSPIFYGHGRDIWKRNAGANVCCGHGFRFFPWGLEMIAPEFLYGTAWKEDRSAELAELAIRTGFRGIERGKVSTSVR